MFFIVFCIDDSSYFSLKKKIWIRWRKVVIKCGGGSSCGYEVMLLEFECCVVDGYNIDKVYRFLCEWNLRFNVS